MHRLIGRFTSALFLSLLVPAMVAAQAPATSPPPQQQPSQQPFTKEQLDQMMAPIALYPDSLLSQVLMAATYPADVVEAAKYSKAHPDAKGEAAVKAVENQNWDPAVKALMAFPQVIQMMGDKPDWTQNLGDAFLASSKDVLDSAQRLRAQANKAGNLKSNEQQKVIVEQEPQAPTQTVIKIEPTNPQTVYVPAYNPTVVYGAWPYPAYPPYYWPPSPYYYPGAALATGFAWGIGIAAGAAIWGNVNWGGGDVNINANRYNTINSNRQISNTQNKFQHNAENRRGTPYRDSGSQQKFDRNVAGADQRQDFRGRDQGRDAQRQQAQNTLQQRGMDPAKERDALRNDPGTRDRAQQAARDTNRGGAGQGQGGFDRGGASGGQGGFDRGGAGGGAGGAGGGFDRGGASPSQRQQGLSGSDNAFRNAGNSGATRQQFDRGASSRQSMNSRPSGGGARAGGGGGARGGGGGRGGGRR